jgi:hypothetical protein
MKKKLNKTKSVFVKNSKMSLAKSTTALTCLVGLFIVSSDPAAAASTSGTFIASTSVAKACTISAGSMTFADYTGSTTITQTSTVTVDCSAGAGYTISFANAADGGNGKYIMQRSGGAVNSANQLLVNFINGSSAAMTSGAATITGTGTGTANSTSHTITGSIASGQTGRTAGTYNATMTLNLEY